MLENEILIRELGSDGILRLILNDPSRRNALSEAMLMELSEAIAEASASSAVRVVVLAARGSAFCAGHDLKELTSGRQSPDGGKAYYSKIMTQCSGVMKKIVKCPKPVIAEVAGVATAAGCQMVASSDLAIAADSAQFSTPGVHIGLFCSTPMVALSRNVSDKHAMEMLLTGDMVTARRAAEMGLVNRVVAPENLTAETMELARKIASKSSMTLATGKQAYYAQREMSLSEAYSYATGVMVENMLTADAAEGIGAFIEKRPAQWSDQ